MARRLFSVIVLAVMAVFPGTAARAADADVVRTIKQDNGGRIELYRDGEVACFDARDRPTVDAGCRSVAQRFVDEEARLQQELANASANQLYLKAGQAERGANSQLAVRYYEAIISRFPDHDLAIRANDNLLAMRRADSQQQNRTAEERRQAEQAQQDRAAEERRRAEQAQQDRAAEERRRVEQAQRNNRCAHVYVGKVFTARTGFGLDEQFEVIGFSSETGQATISNVSSNGSHRQEIDCATIPR